MLDPKRSDVAIKMLQKRLEQIEAKVKLGVGDAYALNFDSLTDEQKAQLRGKDGEDYILTPQDKIDIANMLSDVQGEKVVSKFTNEWDNDTAVYPYGTILIYSDYTIVGDINGSSYQVPAFKVADGTHRASVLPFTSAEHITRLAGALTIGVYTYDGSRDVNVPVYHGDYKEI